jgi:hypothetical protein
MLWRFLLFLAMLGGASRQDCQDGHNKSQSGGASHERQ